MRALPELRLSRALTPFGVARTTSEGVFFFLEVRMNQPLAVTDDIESSLAANLERGEQALAAAETDYERLEVRDAARAAEIFAKALGRTSMIRRFSVLVQRAERAIVKANPPMSREEAGAQKGGVSGTQPFADKNLLREARRAHSQLPDDQFEALAAENTDEPMTRKGLIEHGRPHLSRGTANEGWYTPGDLIELATAVMGEIDLDPASSAEAQEVVKAGAYYTQEVDGLAQQWHGRVFINPPYTAGIVDRYADKLVAEYTRGSVTEAIWLCDNSADTRWFATLADHASVILFLRGRVKFWAPDGSGGVKIGSPLKGQVLIYIGPTPDQFIRECRARDCGRGYLSVHANG